MRLLFDDLPQGGAIRFSDHLEEDGATLVRHACRMGLEGIISKRADQPYRSGRGKDWVKSKCTQRQELVIAGYLPSTHQQEGRRLACMGVYDGGKLVHVGRVGTGFTAETAASLYKTLAPIEVAASAFADKVPAMASRGVKWVKPELVAEVEFRGWTHDGMIRQASFQGLREDKDPARGGPGDRRRSSVRPDPKCCDPRGSSAHPSRSGSLGGCGHHKARSRGVLHGHCRSDPAAHRQPAAVAPALPGRVAEGVLFQKHAWAGLDNDLVQRVTVGDDEAVAIQDLAGLLALVQAGVLEIHPWGSTLKDPEWPDRMIFDLDPGEGVGWDAVVQGAVDVREHLRAFGLESFVKTSGGKGLHVVVPISRRRPGTRPRVLQLVSPLR